MFRMIKYNNQLLPWSETLSRKQGAVEVEMTESEIANFGKKFDVEPIKLATTPDEKPGPGWYKNEKGTWENKEKEVVKELIKEGKIEAEVPLTPEAKMERKKMIKKTVKKLVKK